jgi:hypothetical protein
VAYIDEKDITDLVVRRFIDAGDFRVAAWFSRVNNEIESISIASGVPVASISTPIHQSVKDYCVAYFGMWCCFDNMAVTDNDSPETEKYRVKYTAYLEMCAGLRPRITPGVLQYANASLVESDMVGVGNLWRT